MLVHSTTQWRQPPVCTTAQIVPCIPVPAHARRRALQCRHRDQLCRPTHATAEADAMAGAAPSEGSGTAQAVETSGNSFAAVMDIEEIKKVLPHRYPFLLVDRVVEMDFQKSATGYKNVTMNDNFFTGHFPERAIMPGVLQIEAMAQLAGICMLDPEAEKKDQFFFGGIENCRWRKPVVPGDTLMMKVLITKHNKRYGIVKCDAKAYVGSELVCDAQLTLAMGS